MIYKLIELNMKNDEERQKITDEIHTILNIIFKSKEDYIFYLINGSLYYIHFEYKNNKIYLYWN